MHWRAMISWSAVERLEHVMTQNIPEKFNTIKTGSGLFSSYWAKLSTIKL